MIVKHENFNSFRKILRKSSKAASLEKKICLKKCSFKDVNIRTKTIKCLEENIEHYDINCSNIFLDLSPKAKDI